MTSFVICLGAFSDIAGDVLGIAARRVACNFFSPGVEDTKHGCFCLLIGICYRVDINQ